MSGSTDRGWKEKYSQHEKHPRANGDDEHADDFGVDDVFDDVVHRHDLIDRRLANNASRCGLDVQ